MFVRDTDRVPHPAVELSSAPQVKVVGAWPESMTFPGSLRDPFSTPRLQDFLVKTLHTLAGAVDVNNETVDVLNSLCPRYTHREIAAARAERDHIFRHNPLPERYRPRRPPPAHRAPPGPPVGLVGVPDSEDEVQSDHAGDDCEDMVDQRSRISVSDCDRDVVEEFPCLEEDLSLATKARNSESMENAIGKNSLTEWVEPKQVKIPFQKLRWDLNCEYGQVCKRDPQLVAARLAILKQHPPHRHLECIVWRSPGAMYTATAV